VARDKPECQGWEEKEAHCPVSGEITGRRSQHNPAKEKGLKLTIDRFGEKT